MPDKIYNISKNYKFQGTIISFHGGCFIGGNTSYDYEQNEMLSNLGYVVIQVDFPKRYTDFIYFVENYKFDNIKHPIYCIGRSSGGYLAKIFAETHSLIIQKILYICPVLNPLLRCEFKPQFLEKTNKFFEEHTPILFDSFNFNKELILLATEDNNVPLNCFTKEELKFSIFLDIKTHNEMLKTTSNSFKKIVIDFFK